MFNKHKADAKVVLPPKPDSVTEIVENDYETLVLKAALPVVLDFYSEESEPCKTLAPRFGAVADKFTGKVQFLKIGRQKNPGLAEKMHVTTSPTLLFFKSGKEFGERLTGAEIQRTELKAHVEALLK